MDDARFDSLIKSLSSTDTRRALLRRLAPLPLAGLMATLLPDESEAGRRKRRKKHHQHRSGDDKKNRKGKRKGKRAGDDKDTNRNTPASDPVAPPPPPPDPGCTPTTCAAQGKTCGSISDGCGKTLDCGPCTCASGCHPVCQRCNPATGVCDPNANDTPCDDGDACTQTDTCQNGTCVGSNPVVCNTPPGRCFQATGTCQRDGTCGYAFKPEGAACNDGDDCTQPDACDGAATCVAGASVTCPASDQCHDQGVCNPATGVCSNPKTADGASCDDGDACTRTDRCQNGTCVGSNPVVCEPRDACHVAGSCNPATGLCSNPNKTDGTACNDGDLCTQTDTCQGGVCVGSNPVSCPPPADVCHVQGTCDQTTGLCSNPNAPNGTSCDDGTVCTTDTCQSGVCQGTPVSCTAPATCCPAGTPAAGECRRLAGTGPCSSDDECCSGLCAGGHGCCPTCPAGCGCGIPVSGGTACTSGETGTTFYFPCGYSWAPPCEAPDVCFHVRALPPAEYLCYPTCVPVA